jgi:hypothetical protein
MTQKPERSPLVCSPSRVGTPQKYRQTRGSLQFEICNLHFINPIFPFGQPATPHILQMLRVFQPQVKESARRKNRKDPHPSFCAAFRHEFASQCR